MQQVQNSSATGIVYVLSNEAMPGLIKIGKTTRIELQQRLKELYTTGVPLPFNVEYAAEVSSLHDVEKALHAAFADVRINTQREFFRLSHLRVIPILKLLQTRDITTETDQQLNQTVLPEEIRAVEQFKAKRPNLNFTEMGIALGEKITFVNDNNIQATIVADKKIRLDDNEVETSLTDATRRLLGITYSVQPSPYWMYNGRSLREIYDETYPNE